MVQATGVNQGKLTDPCTKVLDMITGELRSKVDRLWDAFWSGGIANPLEVIEQITYLMFIRRLDDMQVARENKAARTGKPIENPIYAEDDEQNLRWSRFTNEHHHPGRCLSLAARPRW
jgi:hypothetical protein